MATSPGAMAFEATPEVREPVIEVERDGVHYTLLGTAHVSRASAEAVTAIIRQQDFDAVAVELCESRYRALTQPESLLHLDLFEVVKSGRAGLMLAHLVLGGYQKRLAEQFGIEPGAEMRAAIEAAQSRGTPLKLIDRDVGVTLKRGYRKLGWWKRFQLLTGMSLSLFSREQITEADIERLKQGDLMSTAFTEFAQSAPELYQSLISERDRYMAAKLRSVAEPGQRVLAVVGAGHLEGLARALREESGRPASITRALEQVPPPSPWTRLLPWIILVLVLAGFAYGFWRSPELGWAVVFDWVFIHGTLCALGAALAGAHPLTVLAGFIASPITALHPLIGAGMVTALVELYLRKPRMADFAVLREDTAHLKGWWHNRVARTLLIFVLSSLGSALGTWLAGASILNRLF